MKDNVNEPDATNTSSIIPSDDVDSDSMLQTSSNSIIDLLT